MATDKLCVTFKVVEMRVGTLGSRTRVDTINFKGETDLSMGQLREMLSEILLSKAQGPVAVATGAAFAEWAAPVKKPEKGAPARVLVCAAPDCKRSFVPVSSTQRFCGKKECKQWGKSHPAKHYRKRGVEYKKAAGWKPAVTVEAGNGVVKGTALQTGAQSG
jgi:hypothetical protein